MSKISVKSCKTTIDQVEGMTGPVFLYYLHSHRSHVYCNSQAARGRKNMRITHKAEVRYAVGDADAKCPAYCWAPA